MQSSLPTSGYERDHSVYEAQYQAAWQELMQQRLPTPPQGYYWYHYAGGIILGDTYFFRLWHSDLGYAPAQE